MKMAPWHSSFAALALVVPGTSAQELDLRDLESRIEYAWFTEDPNSLRNLIRATENSLARGSDSALIGYELALAHFRLGLLLVHRAGSDAAEAVSRCIDRLDRVIKADERFAEAYALQSACYDSLSGLRAWKAVMHGPLSASRMNKALQLAPDNPRIALLDGMADLERPRAFGGDRARARSKFERAVRLFETDSGQTSGGPRWGAGDAYLHLGRGLLDAGDIVGARNALERALIIAPDYVAVRRELQRLTEAAR